MELASLNRHDTSAVASLSALLLDPARSSTLKLVAIERLKERPPAEAVPILAEFLAAAPSGSTAIPSAVRALVDFNDPIAEEALSKLSLESADTRVLIAIAALRGGSR